MSASVWDIARRQRRTDLAHDVRVMFARESEGGREMPVTGRIVNQSEEGFCIQTSSLVREGDLLRALVDLGQETDCYFHVRWVRHEGAATTFGCNFVDLSIDGVLSTPLN